MKETVTKYRYDLDGLRGIAIAFVVIFHVFVGKVSGGVDVFLLLSGYFFLGAQLRYAAKPDASLNVFWPIWRTLRRLFPSLVVVLVTTAVLVDVFAPQLRIHDLGAHLKASLLYYQNWQLASEGAAYGAAADTVSPMQHLWSMAVQGQFYLLAIGFSTLLAWVVRMRRKHGASISQLRHLAGVPLIIATVASFAYAWHMEQVAQDVNYYSTWSRMWELTLGATLAVYSDTLSRRAARWGKASNVLSYIGLFMVLSTGFLFEGARQFPGPATLYPLGGAALMIISVGAGIAWLASGFMRWLGSIAYPLYLWHWPLLIVGTVAFGQSEPSALLGVSVILISLVLAHLTHIFVEEPLRQHAKRPVRGEQRVAEAVRGLRRHASARLRALTAVIVVALGASVLWVPQVWEAEQEQLAGNRLDPRLYPGAMATVGARVPTMPPEPDPYLLASSLSPAWTAGCMSNAGDDPTVLAIDNFDPEYCTFGDPNADFTAYLIGGSHAEQWMAAFDEIGKQHHFKVVPIVRQGCPAFVEELDGVFSEDCQQFNQTMVERLRQDQPDLVISNSTRPLPERLRFEDEVPLSYRTLWNFLEEQNIAFVGLRDNPWFIEEGGAGRMVSICQAEKQDEQECGMPRDEAYAGPDPAAALLNGTTMISIDTSNWFCPNGFCSPVIGNIYVYRDGNHISDDYARSTIPLLWAQMEPVLKAAGWEPTAG